MKKNLVNERQQFGTVRNETPMGGQGRPAEHVNKTGAMSVIENHGRTVVESFGDKNPSAYQQACRGVDNPFWPTGHPKQGA